MTEEQITDEDGDPKVAAIKAQTDEMFLLGEELHGAGVGVAELGEATQFASMHGVAAAVEIYGPVAARAEARYRERLAAEVQAERYPALPPDGVVHDVVWTQFERDGDR